MRCAPRSTALPSSSLRRWCERLGVLMGSAAAGAAAGAAAAASAPLRFHTCVLLLTALLVVLQVKADALEREVQAVDNEFAGVLQVQCIAPRWVAC